MPDFTLAQLLRTLASTASVAFALAGCAAYRHCGLGGCPGDAAITADVRALFKREPAFGPPAALDVQTADRVVYLYGLVDTEMERRLAGSVALEAAGAARVVNLLGVNSNGR